MILQRRHVVVQDGNGVLGFDQEVIVQAPVLKVMTKRRNVGRQVLHSGQSIALHNAAMTQ